MKSYLKVLGLLVFAWGSSTLFASEDSYTEKKLLVCNQLAQEDLLQIRLVQRGPSYVIVLVQKDGEIEQPTKVVGDIKNYSYTLPPWKGETRLLRNDNSGWGLFICGGSVCRTQRINCTL